MAAKAKIRMGQIGRAQKLLQDLPEKDDRKTREEAALLLENDFRKALKKGYSPKELSAVLKNEGIIIPAYLVERFLTSESKTTRPKIMSKPAMDSGVKTVTSPTPAEGEFLVTPDTPLEDL